jgi:hypothetical protein
MKTLLTVGLMVLSTTVFSQTLKHEQLELGSARPANDFTEYIASNGESFKIGNKVTINQPSGNSNTFQYILRNVATETYTAGTDANNTEGEILKFRVGGTKKAGWEIWMVLKTGEAWRYQVNIEQALAFKEIKSSILSREDAIAKLKESKDLFDLGLMTQEEYEAIKKELTPIIMGGN